MFGKNDQPLILGRSGFTSLKIYQKQRTDHLYIIGGSRIGKTSEIYNLILQDAGAKRGLGVVDVHGDLVGYLERAAYRLIPDEKEKKDRLIILDPTRGSFGFNPLEVPEGEDPYPYVLELISVFKKLWEDSWGARMEDILRNTFLVIAEKGLTMLDIPRFLTDQYFRRQLIKDLGNEQVREYWLYRFGPLAPKTKAEWIESTLNKVDTFIADPLIKVIVGQQKSTIHFRKIMDNPKGSILLIRLPKGILKQNAFLLGALLISKIQEAVMSRVDIPLEERIKFFLYVDEFQHFGTKSLNFQECLSESGKYNLSLILAHQNLGQIDDSLLESILGNSSIQLIFRISRMDAEIIGKEIFQVDTDKIKWERTQDLDEVVSRTYYSPQEEWEKYFNLLTTLKKRHAYLNIKAKGTYPLRTIDTKYYSVSEEEVQAQAQEIMVSYCISSKQFRKERGKLKNILKNKEAKDLSLEMMRE
ncbi:hypothetical protein ES705_05777 [subsurface metagenome]